MDLDIYVISLSKKGLDDSGLNELVSKLPSRSLALMEEIDAAFFHGVSRNDNMSQSGKSVPDQLAGIDSEPTTGNSPGNSTGGAVTLSGLLGAIDGVTAQEGRLLFATTNRYSALDTALVRPGRLDVHVRFENAGRAQIEELFRCFFLPSISSQPSGKLIDGEENERFSDSDEGYGTLSDNSHDELDEDISPGNASVLL